jgi:hypothetical protein
MNQVIINGIEHWILFGHKSLELYCAEQPTTDTEGNYKPYTALDAMRSLQEPKNLYRYFYAALQAGAWYKDTVVIAYKEFMLALDTDKDLFNSIKDLFDQSNGIKK